MPPRLGLAALRQAPQFRVLAYFMTCFNINACAITKNSVIVLSLTLNTVRQSCFHVFGHTHLSVCTNSVSTCRSWLFHSSTTRQQRETEVGDDMGLSPAKRILTHTDATGGQDY